MAKAKVTRKWLRENYRCIAVGYCDLQYLLGRKSARYYTCGVYGWNFDAYVLLSDDGRELCVTTGYRGMIDNCFNNYTHELGKSYDERARELFASCPQLDGLDEGLKALESDFVKHVLR